MTILRPLDPVADGPALHGIFGNEACCRYLTRPATKSVAETIALLASWTDTDAQNTSWAVLDPDTKAVAGRVSIFETGGGNWEIAVMLLPAAHGRGLAYRAAMAALDITFDQHEARRIVADIDPDNHASLALFTKLGFMKEGYLRAAWHTHIGVRDTVLMAMLRTDPRPWRT